MARLRSDQQKEADNCHYVVTLPTQIFLDVTLAETASRGTSFVGMAEGDLFQRKSCSSVFLRSRPPYGREQIRHSHMHIACLWQAMVRSKRSPRGARVVV